MEGMMDKPVLYVDMDNTLFSFPEESITCFEDFYKPGLFINEKPHWNVIHAVHMIHEAGDLQVRIISAFPDAAPVITPLSHSSSSGSQAASNVTFSVYLIFDSTALPPVSSAEILLKAE